VVLGLGERTEIRGSHAAPTEVPTCLNNFPTTKNDAASAHLKTEIAGFAGPASKESEKEARALKYGKVTYTFFGARKLRIINNNNKVKVVGPGPPWCLAPCRPGLNQFNDQGNKCVGSGLAWMGSGIKGINYANSGLAWVSCEHVGQALGLHVRCLAPFRPGLEKVLNKEN